MAETTEAQVVVVAMEDNEGVDLEKLDKELMAKALAADAVTPLGAQQVRTTINIRNLTQTYVRPLASHFWAGGPGTFMAIAPRHTFATTLRGTLSEGIKFGIAYAEGRESTSRMWLVAYDTLAKKAYAAARPFGPIDWNVIEVRLRTGGHFEQSYDHILGGTTIAQILPDNPEHVLATFQ